MLEKYIQFIKAHERIILVAIVGLVLWFSFGKIDTLLIHHDSAQVQQAIIVAQTNAQETAKVEAQAEAQAIQYKQLTDKVQAQNDKLAQANAALIAALSVQQKKDAEMDIPQLAQRWTQLVPSVGLSTTDGHLEISDIGAHTTVSQLEQVPTLTAELAAEQTKELNDLSLLTSANTRIDTLNQNVTLLNTQITDNQNVCKAQIAEVKAKARKSKWHFFEAGVVVGFLGRQLIKMETGF